MWHAQEARARLKETDVDAVVAHIERVLVYKGRLMWSPSELEELFATLAAVRGTLQGLNDPHYVAVNTWFVSMVRHMGKCATNAHRVFRLFEEQQDKWYFRPVALAREADRVDQALQAAMEVVANAEAGVTPSPLSALRMPESRTFWLTKVGTDGDLFDVDINAFQEAVVEELDPDGSWTGKTSIKSLFKHPC